jgi:sugar phosphate isomerase/epimerase
LKLAISNIAWARDHDGTVATLMRRYGVSGVEIAPTTLWREPLAAPDGEVRAVRDWWGQRGMSIVALQALLFGRADLKLFAGSDSRAGMLAHLDGMIGLAARLGARVLVFGSPKNRERGALPPEEALDVATAFFREAAGRAAARGVVLCVEPNPSAYGCDFVNTTEEGVALVRAVDHPGFGLHLDGGALTLNGEQVAAAITSAMPVLRHFHASEPHLKPLGEGGTDHAACAGALRAAGYDAWVSVEMRQTPGGGVEELARVLELLEERYGG